MLRAPEKPAQLVILLHGYLLRGEWMYRKLERAIPDNAVILSPSGPFPLIRRKPGEGPSDSLAIGYTWYFYDKNVDEYLIDMRVGTDFVVNLVRHLKLDTLPTTLIGFSQGGFLAPSIASQLKSCRRVVGIACEFLPDEMEFPVHYRMDQIHGESDDVVLLADAKKSHDRLRAKGVAGEFTVIPGLGHKIEDQVRAKIRDILLS